MKKTLNFLFVVLLLIGLPACVPPTPLALQGQGLTQPPPDQSTAAGDPEVKIGILVPLTGPVATFGSSTRNGVEMAVADWNLRGGVLGKQVVIALGDSQCGKDQAITAANQLIREDGVRYIVGDVCSGGSFELASLAEDHGILQVSPASTLDRLTLNLDGTTRKYVFRACFTDNLLGSAAGSFAAQNLGARRVFILSDADNDYSLELAKAFEAAITQGGGEIVGRGNYSPGDTDFSVLFAQISKAQPDLIFLGDAYATANVLVAQARKKGITTRFFGGDGWDSTELDLQATDGDYFATHFSPVDQRNVVQEWVKAYQARYQALPDGLAALGYDATNLVLSAITKAGEDDPAKVAQALEGLSWEGVTGKISFNSQHNPIKPVAIMEVKGGQVRYVTSVKP